VTKSGSYFSFGDERLGQGRQNATAFLREHPDVTQQVLQQIQVELGSEQVASARLLPVVGEELEKSNGKAEVAAEALASAEAEA
jgi:recombination protein RecA